MGVIGGLLILVILFFIVEVLAIALKITGLDIQKARFQVISIITNTGFTTKEAELITQHPTRRKIAQILMLISYVGYATLIALVVNIIQSHYNALYLIVAIVVIAFIVLMFFRNKWLGKRLEGIIERQLSSRMKREKYKTVEEVLKLNDEYGVVEFVIEEGSSLIGRTLLDSKLTQKHIQVLNIDKGSHIIHFPKSSYSFGLGDKVTVYGKLDRIKELVMGQYSESTVDMYE